MKILCGQCGRMMDYDPADGASSVRCSHCDHQIPLTGQQEQDGAPVLPAESQDVGFAEAAREAMKQSLRLRVECGKCGKPLKVGVRRAGKTVRCPACHGQIRIPYPDEEDDFEIEALAAANFGSDETLELAPEEGSEELARQSLAHAESLTMAVAPRARTRRSRQDVRRRAIRRHGRKATLWLWLVSAASLASLLAGVFYVLAGNNDKPDAADTAGSRPAAPAEANPVTPAVPQDRPVAGKSDPHRPPEQADPEAKAELSILSAQLSVFRDGNRFAAPPDAAWLRVTVGLRAGTDPIELDVAERIALIGPGQALGCIGWATGLDGRLSSEAIRIGPQRYLAADLLFQVPTQWTAATLRIEDLGQVELAMEPSKLAAGPGDPGPQGSYREIPPRNLKPMLRDKTMAAIQQARQVEIQFQPGTQDGQLQVQIPAAGLTGSARPTGPGAYELAVSGRAGDLVCRLRYLPNNTFILYLRDEPFHQMTFASVKIESPQQPEPVEAIQPQPLQPEPEKPGQGDGFEFFGQGGD